MKPNFFLLSSVLMVSCLLANARAEDLEGEIKTLEQKGKEFWEKGDLAQGIVTLKSLRDLSIRQYGKNDWRTVDREENLAYTERYFAADTELRAKLASVMQSQAQATTLGNNGDFDGELKAAQLMVKMAVECHGENSRWSGVAHRCLAGALFHQLDVDASLQAVDHSIACLEKSVGKKHPEYFNSLLQKGGILKMSGRPLSGARQLRTLTNDLNAMGDFGWNLQAHVPAEYALALSMIGRLDEAIALVQKTAIIADFPKEHFAAFRSEWSLRIAEIMLRGGLTEVAGEACMGVKDKPIQTHNVERFLSIFNYALIEHQELKAARDNFSNHFTGPPKSNYAMEAAVLNCKALYVLGEVDQCKEFWTKTSEVVEREFKGFHHQKCSAHLSLGRIALALNDRDLLHKAIERSEQYLKKKGADNTIHYAENRYLLAHDLCLSGKPEEAIRVLDDAIELRRQLQGETKELLEYLNVSQKWLTASKDLKRADRVRAQIAKMQKELDDRTRTAERKAREILAELYYEP